MLFLVQETDTGIGKDTLTHWESLLIVSTGDTEEVPGKFVTEVGAVDLLGHGAFVEVLEVFFVINLD